MRHNLSIHFNIKQKVIFIAILFFSLVLFIKLFHFIKHHQCKPENIAKKIEYSIQNKNKKLATYLSKCSQQSSDSFRRVNIFKSIENILSDNPEFFLFISENDSLLFWSDNSVPIPKLKNVIALSNQAILLSNGYYIINTIQKGSTHFTGLYKIKSKYPYENQHLINRFQLGLNISPEIEVSLNPGEYNLYNNNEILLFSLDFPDEITLSESNRLFISFLYILAFVFLNALFYNLYLLISSQIKNRLILLIGFFADVVILRLLIFYYQYPGQLYNSELFNPQYFASSWYLPSLGDLSLNLISIFAIAVALFKFVRIKDQIKLKSNYLNYILFNFILVLLFILFEYLTNTIQTLVLNSTLHFNLNYISEVDVLSIFGFLCLALLIASFIFLSFKFIVLLAMNFSSGKNYLLFLISNTIIIGLAFSLIYQTIPFHFIFLFLYLSIFWQLNRKRIERKTIEFSFIMLLVLIFAIYSTYILQISNAIKEKENRVIYAEKIMEQRDPVVEYKFSLLENQMLSDTRIIQNKTLKNQDTYNSIDELSEYIYQTYFVSEFSNYDVILTICDPELILDIQSESISVNCFEYFNSILIDYSKETNFENLFYIDYEFTNDNYLGVINLSNDSTELQLFVELYSKNMPRELGYPELLMDEKNQDHVDWVNYSFAIYEQDKLVYRFGNYFYSMDLSIADNFEGRINFVNHDKYNHLFYKIDDITIIVVSYKIPGIFEIAAPFSFISLLYGFFALLLLFFIRTPLHFNLSNISLKSRLQLFITALIIASFVFIGVASIFYIISLNTNKNYSILSEKSHSVLIELEHKIANEDKLTMEMEDYLSGLLIKFSLVFFSDINLYSTDGTLLASSRPEIFKKELISRKMNPTAFYNLSHEKKSRFILEENIGDYSYLSAYLPFINYNNELIGYLNLPYFAKQKELTKEISNFLVAFINIYVILIAFAIYITLVISNYITRPLQILKDKISSLKLGKTDQKINWTKKDEIGSLVTEYNRMVDELGKSAELLAKSERESAWREMAKQIAHEIKNPLTPMKLSVQFLQKAWNEKLPDWEERLNRFTNTIVEQIESLSIIASEFSDFANMPRSKFHKVDVVEIISNAVDLYKDSTQISITLQGEKPMYVLADKEQLLRVFINLIKNSIQAIDQTDQGIISLSVNKYENQIIIRCYDNGRGIHEQQKSQVFYPNFTTKSGGMGLGLALVKNIISNANGTISFDSEPGKGTTFNITLPAYQE